VAGASPSELLARIERIFEVSQARSAVRHEQDRGDVAAIDGLQARMCAYPLFHRGRDFGALGWGDVVFGAKADGGGARLDLDEGNRRISAQILGMPACNDIDLALVRLEVAGQYRPTRRPKMPDHEVFRAFARLFMPVEFSFVQYPCGLGMRLCRGLSRGTPFETVGIHGESPFVHRAVDKCVGILGTSRRKCMVRGNKFSVINQGVE